MVVAESVVGTLDFEAWTWARLVESSNVGCLLMIENVKVEESQAVMKVVQSYQA